MRKNQKEKIIDYINQFGAITSMEAFSELGITQLGARIFELERDGYSFIKEWKTRKNKLGEDVEYKKYSLASMEDYCNNHIPHID